MARKGRKKREAERLAKIEAMTRKLVKPPLKVSAPATKKKSEFDSVVQPVCKPLINLSVACPTTGFIRMSCGCVRCMNARKNNKRVR